MLGRKCKAYYLSTGTRATWGTLDAATGRHEGAAPANLTAIESVKDVKLPGDRMNATQTDRGAAVESGDTGAIQGTVTVTLNRRATDAGRTALETAFLLNTPIAMAFLTGDSATAGVRGLWADWKVTKFVENQPESDHVTYDVELIPYSEAAVDLEWIEVTAA
jgi:hypothetical protein